jgi:hypothetical protein
MMAQLFNEEWNMEVNASLILDVWELFGEYLPTNRREDIANKLIKIFADKGVEQDDLEAIKGEDNYLDTAIDNFREIDHDDEDEYDYESTDYDPD